MTDDARLTLLDDPLDPDVHELLLGLDRGPALTVDIDEVVLRGGRHRRVVTAERVLAVAAAVVVVAGVAVFAVGRSGPHDVAPLGPTASPHPSSTRVLGPWVSDGWWYTMGDPTTQTGLAVAGLKNESTEDVTVSAPVVSGDPGVRAVLSPLVPVNPAATTVSIEYLQLLDKPVRPSVVVPPGRTVFVVIGVPATCTGADDQVSAVVTVALRSASGGTDTVELGAQRGPSDSWQRAARRAACGSRAAG
jgi:hypothetical protein